MAHTFYDEILIQEIDEDNEKSAVNIEYLTKELAKLENKIGQSNSSGTNFNGKYAQCKVSYMANGDYDYRTMDLNDFESFNGLGIELVESTNQGLVDNCLSIGETGYYLLIFSNVLESPTPTVVSAKLAGLDLFFGETTNAGYINITHFFVVDSPNQTFEMGNYWCPEGNTYNAGVLKIIKLGDLPAPPSP
jgi:hypothetical protein